MPTDLPSIVADLSEAFPDGFLPRSLHDPDDLEVPERSAKVVLADFIVGVVAENYDPDSSESANLLRIHTALQETELLLHDVVERSRVLWRRSLV